MPARGTGSRNPNGTCTTAARRVETGFGEKAERVTMIKAILLLLLVTNALILVHELGHLVAAKWAGMPVRCFSVGFGPRLFGFRIGETRYQLALVPLGGYVRIAGMRGTEEERRKWPSGFAFQRVHRRMIVVVAGGDGPAGRATPRACV